MALPTRNIEQRRKILARRAQVTALWLARYTAAQIAEQLGQPHPTICRDIIAIRKEYLATRNDLIEREMVEMEQIEQECWLHYSQAVHAKDSEGAHRWLHERMVVKKQRAELLGLNAPTRLDLRIARMPDEDVKRELARRLMELARTALPPGPDEIEGEIIEAAVADEGNDETISAE